MELKLIEYQPIPPNCPKCGQHGDMGVSVEYVHKKGAEDGKEFLRCSCACGYWWGMKTKDTKKEA